MAVDENIKSQLVDVKSLNLVYNRLLKQTSISSSKSAYPTFSATALYPMLTNSGTITLINKPRSVFTANAENEYKNSTLTNGALSAFAFELKNILISSKCLVDTFVVQNFMGDKAEDSDTQIYSNGNISIYPNILSKGVPTISTEADNYDVNNGVAIKITGKNTFIAKSGAYPTVSDLNSSAYSDYTNALTIKGYDIYSGTSSINMLSNLTQAALNVTGGIYASNGICATKIFNAVWNDIADCITVDCELESGYCYMFDGKHYSKTTKYADKGFIGIHSDTAGFYVGQKGGNELHVAIGGFVLAYVDKEYPVGTPLTCSNDGKVTKMKKLDALFRPHRIIGTYWKPETEETWGPVGQQINVNGRHWIKIQ